MPKIDDTAALTLHYLGMLADRGLEFRLGHSRVQGESRYDISFSGSNAAHVGYDNSKLFAMAGDAAHARSLGTITDQDVADSAREIADWQDRFRRLVNGPAQPPDPSKPQRIYRSAVRNDGDTNIPTTCGPPTEGFLHPDHTIIRFGDGTVACYSTVSQEHALALARQEARRLKAQASP